MKGILNGEINKFKVTSTLFFKPVLLVFFVFLFVKNVDAQSNIDSLATNTLYHEIALMDSILFDAFNTQDVAKMKTLFTEDLEWYQDNGGLLTYKTVLDSTVCSSDLKV
jgi:hypothetical protein